MARCSDESALLLHERDDVEDDRDVGKAPVRVRERICWAARRVVCLPREAALQCASP